MQCENHMHSRKSRLFLNLDHIPGVYIASHPFLKVMLVNKMKWNIKQSNAGANLQAIRLLIVEPANLVGPGLNAQASFCQDLETLSIEKIARTMEI